MKKEHFFGLLCFFALACLSLLPSAKGETPSTTRSMRPAMGAAANPLSPQETALISRVFQWVQKSERCLDHSDLLGAQQAAEKALRIAGPQRQEWLADYLAPVYMRKEQYQQAAALFGPHLALSLNAAIAFVKTGRMADARKCYRLNQVLFYHQDLKPYMPDTSNARSLELALFLGRGIVDVDQNNPVSALWALHHALQLSPKNPLTLWYYAEALAAVGRVQEANSYYTAVIKNDHGVVAARARVGMARLSRRA